MNLPLIIAAHAALVAVAAGMLTPVPASKWRYAAAILGPLTILYLAGVTMTLLADRMTRERENA